MFNPAVIIPVYNHDRHIGALVDEVLGMELPCILVDDGSVESCARVLDAIAEMHRDRVTLVRREQNGGKGAAVLSGLARAYDLGFSHAVQIDADGQHTTADIPKLLQYARATPKALVTGQPRFDDDVPRSRLYLRYLTHWMVSINTLTPALRDAMCGFRVYPVRRVLALERIVRFGRRMDFDIEVLVRLDWAGVPIVLLPTRVRYPKGGVSHFQLWRDNVRITRMHTKLFFGMLVRIPTLRRRRSASR